MRYLLFLSFLVVFSCFPLEVVVDTDKELGKFSGRISKINEYAELVRVKVDFSNLKYLNKDNKVEFWAEETPQLKCRGVVFAKTNEHLLLKVPKYEICAKKFHVAEGKYILLNSEDLVNNIKIGKEVISVLVKKRMALQGKLQTNNEVLASFINRVEVVNKRYDLLRQKLESEWKTELDRIEEDRIIAEKNKLDTAGRLSDVDRKLEQYRIEDNNLKEDRWALDSVLHIKK